MVQAATYAPARIRTAPVMTKAKLFHLARKALAFPTRTEAARYLLRVARRVPPQTHWRREFVRLGKALAAGVPASPVFQTEGNGKLPFVSFSTLPVLTCHGYGECGRWCYSFRSWRYPAAFCRQLQNTILLKHDPDLVRVAWLALPEGVTVRLYVDGDFGTAADVELWMDLLHARPDLRAYGYSKSWELLWGWHVAHGGDWPANYVLNLSSGGRPQSVTAEQMRSLPVVRGEFLSLPVDYRPAVVRGNIGFKRFQDPDYHRAVRAAGRERGLKVFSCPGYCGECNANGHACGSERFRGVVIAIGVH
jgi:hypothetical protein